MSENSKSSKILSDNQMADRFLADNTDADRENAFRDILYKKDDKDDVREIDVCKKKIAIFANGWNNVNLYRFLDGLYHSSDSNFVDYYLFLTHAVYADREVIRNSKGTIFDLPDLSFFDAAILYTPGLNFKETIDYMVAKLKNSGIFTILIGMTHPDFCSVCVDNYVGMRELCEHLVTEHNVKKACYIAGAAENDDSNIRLKALLDTANSHGIDFVPERDVFYSNWEVMKCYSYLTKRLLDDDFPEAFICANDQLAQGVSYFIEDNGLPFVGKYIVTGFDYLDESQNFYPSIASVDQKYGEMGTKTYELLKKYLNGETFKQEVLVKCQFIPGESCGCMEFRNDEEKRHKFYRSSPRKSIGLDFREGRIHSLEQTFILATGFDDLHDRMKTEFGDRDGFEGDTMAIMIDPRVADFSTIDIGIIEKYSFCEKMDILVGKHEGKIIEEKYIKTCDLIPWNEKSGKNRLYVFSPMFFDTFVCGYSVFVDRYDWIRDVSFSSIEVRFNHGLVSYRRNMQLADLNAKLSEIMEKDPLTSVKNRIAYERCIAKLEERFNAKNLSKFAVVFFDINNLKTINDKLGHEQGDLYIKNCCKYICDFYKHSPVFRIGGDEFVAIITEDDYDNCKESLMAFREKMKEISSNEDKYAPVERISIASGMAEYNGGDNEDFKAILKHADEMMYQNKFLMKNGNVR